MTTLKVSKMSVDQQYMLLSKGEREYAESTEEEINDKYERPDLAHRQFSTRIKHRAINALKEIAWLCDKLPDDRLKKIFEDSSIEALFKIQEKALLITEYPLAEGYDMTTTFLRGGIPESGKIEQFRKYDEKKLERFLIHLDTEIDALTHNPIIRKILKADLRDPDGYWQEKLVLRTRELEQLKSEYDKHLITATEYAERRNELDPKLKELSM